MLTVLLKRGIKGRDKGVQGYFSFAKREELCLFSSGLKGVSM